MTASNNFPFTAWYVTEALNVRKLTVLSRYHGGYYNCTPRTLMHYTEFFPDRQAAVAEASRRLEAAEVRFLRAGRRIQNARRMVAKVKGGAA